jgi:hypothetical protein
MQQSARMLAYIFTWHFEAPGTYLEVQHEELI